MGGAGRDTLRLFGGARGGGFEIRVVSVAPGGERGYDETEWRDAMVVVEQGEIEIEARGGQRWCFGPGDVLWLVGLPVMALHSRGPGPAVLVALSRRRVGRQTGAVANPRAP